MVVVQAPLNAAIYLGSAWSANIHTVVAIVTIRIAEARFLKVNVERNLALGIVITLLARVMLSFYDSMDLDKLSIAYGCFSECWKIIDQTN